MSEEKRVLATGKYLRLIHENGWEYVERAAASGVVIILAVTDDRKLVLVEQYRKPVHTPVIELPAGLVGDIAGQENEEMAIAAYRELLEETGYQAAEMQVIMEGPTSPGLCAEKVTFFRAIGLKKVGQGGGDETESIIVHEISLDHIESWLTARIKEGALVDPKVYAGLYFAHVC